MKIEITMTELLLIVDMIKNGVEKTEPENSEDQPHRASDDDIIILKRKNKKKKK
jgi:hypothetical protein